MEIFKIVLSVKTLIAYNVRLMVKYVPDVLCYTASTLPMAYASVSIYIKFRILYS